MNCTNCGATLLPNAQFCGACGTRVANTGGVGAQSGGGASEVYGEPRAGGDAEGRGGASRGAPGNFGDTPGLNRGETAYPSGPFGANAAGRTSGAAGGPAAGGGYGGGAGAPGAGHGIHIDADSRGQGRGYSYEILHQPSFALAVVRMQAEQSIQAESGAMVSMSANIELQSQMKGGLLGALKRSVGGESAFVSTFTARGGPGEVTFAPGGPGD
ncbi:MAG TPA: AIM24 family protein, partial [Pyrinomonadaceae bacterium]|nr:AIM24 family protein [Pyrinomonadaceae bacterium]